MAATSKTRVRIVKVPITMSMKEVEAENRHRCGPQCAAIYVGRSSMRFCIRRENHKDDHRADGVQWREEEVPMTPTDERRQKRAVSDLIGHLVGRMAAKG